MQTSVIKKTLLLALLLATGSAWAEWVNVAWTDSSDFYIDPATIRKDGNLVRVWQLHNHKQRNKNGELSDRVRWEYDCKQERARILSFSSHSEPMAGGKNLFQSSSEDIEWAHIPPNSVKETMLKIACAK